MLLGKTISEVTKSISAPVLSLNKNLTVRTCCKTFSFPQLIPQFRDFSVNMDFEAAIKEQGDLVRKLKSQKADKGLIKAEVDKLLALKTQAAPSGGVASSKEDAGQDGKKFVLKCPKGLWKV